MPPEFDSIEDGLRSLAAGEIVLVLDSTERENEGDFLLAAEMATPEKIHFMISEGRGQLCMPIVSSVAQRLRLAPMIAQASDAGAPRFTIPIDHCNCKTGVSPLERCTTIRAMLDEESRAEDFTRPGHLFPLVAEDEGVLARPGHTEAAIDLARLAGLTPAGVLCEVCSRDGLHMAERSELLSIAADFGLAVVTIDDLIAYRRRTEARSGSRWVSDVGESLSHPAARSHA